jgi:hypothetical protein
MSDYHMSRRISIRVACLLICLVSGGEAMSQTMPQKGVWLKIGLFMEQIALPGVSSLKYGMNPGIQLGAEYHYGSRGNFALFHSVDYAFSVNRAFGTSNLLTTQFGPKYVHQNMLISLGVGGGYNLFHPKNPVYRIERGNYRPRATQGKWVGAATASYGHQIGRFMPYASYGFYIDSPFINSSSTLLPHQFFQLGLKMNGL